jgi:hypothetical protein
MLETTPEIKAQPPRLIPSLIEGFNAIASHIYVIIFPVVLDLLLWFGPLIRIKNLLLPVILNATEISAPAYGADSQSFIKTSKEMWTTILSQFNMLSSLRTFPVGIPSLLVSKGVTRNPLGQVQIIELQSAENAFWMLLGLIVFGLVLGCIYFAIIARITDPSSKPLKVSQMAGEIIQCVLLSIILVFVLFILSVPAICLVSSLALFLPALGSLPLLVLSLILVWALLPIVFSPHGIFANRFKAGASIANSFRLVRSSMNGTGMLFIVLILLGYGLDILWSTPTPDSWMLMVGIVGHGFISSGLIAASFAFYNKGMVWLQAVVREINAGKPKIIA